MTSDIPTEYSQLSITSIPNLLGQLRESQSSFSSAMMTDKDAPSRIVALQGLRGVIVDLESE